MEKDYKKLYEDALETAKAYYKQNKGVVDGVECLSIIFPELAECEDEKIRKMLLELAENCGKANFKEVTREQTIAWLKKQGEQKTKVIISKFRIGDVIIKSTKAKWEKPVRIVSIEKDGYSTIPIDTYGGGFIGFAFEEEYELYKQEWSEGDERHKNTIIRAIHGACNITSIEGELAEKWLTSLKKRYTWKPTDEQMTALRRMKAAIAGEGEIYGPLNSLYEDLNKLLEK